MNLKININFLEKYLAYLINDIEYKRITKKLKNMIYWRTLTIKDFIILDRLLINYFP